MRAAGVLLFDPAPLLAELGAVGTQPIWSATRTGVRTRSSLSHVSSRGFWNERHHCLSENRSRSMPDWPASPTPATSSGFSTSRPNRLPIQLRQLRCDAS